MEKQKKPTQILKNKNQTTVKKDSPKKSEPFQTGLMKPSVVVDENKAITPQAPFVAPTSQVNEIVEPAKEVKKERNKINYLLVLIIIILLLLLGLKNCENTGDGLNFGNGSVNDGALTLGDYDEIKAGLQAGVDESYMNFKINLNVSVDSRTQEAILMIQNTEGNKYNVKVDIYLANEEEDHVYVSPLVKPNQFIEADKLTTSLPIGEHEALAVFTVLEDETNKMINQIGVKLTLTVK